MQGDNAAEAQYATPTPGPPIGTPTVGPPVPTHNLPNTGLSVAPLLLAGFCLILLGVLLYLALSNKAQASVRHYRKRR
jgi:LPXTG-motif cell wall-anchored protein